MSLPTYLTVPCMVSTTTITTGATTVVIKASAGILGSVLVSGAGTGTGSIVFYDSATTNSGTILATTTTSALPLAGIYTFNMPAANGITVVQISNGPTMTISYT